MSSKSKVRLYKTKNPKVEGSIDAVLYQFHQDKELQDMGEDAEEVKAITEQAGHYYFHYYYYDGVLNRFS